MPVLTIFYLPSEDGGIEALRATVREITPGLGPSTYSMALRNVSMALALLWLRRDLPLTLSSWSFVRRRPSLEAAPPWITDFTKIPAKTAVLILKAKKLHQYGFLGRFFVLENSKYH